MRGFFCARVLLRVATFRIFVRTVCCVTQLNRVCARGTACDIRARVRVRVGVWACGRVRAYVPARTLATLQRARSGSTDAVVCAGSHSRRAGIRGADTLAAMPCTPNALHARLTA